MVWRGTGSPVGTPLTENAIYLIDDVQMAGSGPNISGVEFSARAGQLVFGTGFTPEMAEFLNANPTDGIYICSGWCRRYSSKSNFADDLYQQACALQHGRIMKDSDGLDPPALKLQLNYGDNRFLLDDGSRASNLLSTGTGVADTITITDLVYNSDGTP